MSGQCQETTGFLFPHPCDSPAAHRCAVSNLPICATHAHEVPWTDLEAAGLVPAGAPHASPTAIISTTVARRLEQHESSRRSRGRHSHVRSRWSNTPFFYDYNRYDPYDFQPGDAIALRRLAADAADDGEFEHDMQGS